MPERKLHEIFVALIVSRISYTLTAWGGFLTDWLTDWLPFITRSSAIAVQLLLTTFYVFFLEIPVEKKQKRRFLKSEINTKYVGIFLNTVTAAFAACGLLWWTQSLLFIMSEKEKSKCKQPSTTTMLVTSIIWMILTNTGYYIVLIFIFYKKVIRQK